MRKAYFFSGLVVAALSGCASVPPAQPGTAPMTQTVLFDSGSARIAPAYDAALSDFVRRFECKDGYNVVVEGHTDSTGKETLNTQLSERRANNVRMDLISKGVPADHVTAAGFGEAAPVSSNKSAAGRAQNRRASVIATLTEQGCTKRGGWRLPHLDFKGKGNTDQGVPKYLYRNNDKEGNG